MISVVLLALLSTPTLFGMNQYMMNYVKDCLSTASKQKDTTCYLQQVPLEVINGPIAQHLSLADQAALQGTCKIFSKIPLYITRLHPRFADKGVPIYIGLGDLLCPGGIFIFGCGFCMSNTVAGDPVSESCFFNTLRSFLGSGLMVLGCGFFVAGVACEDMEEKFLKAQMKNKGFGRIMKLYKNLANRMERGLITGVNKLYLDYYTQEQIAPLLDVVNQCKISNVTIDVHSCKHFLELNSIVAHNITLRTLEIIGFEYGSPSININSFVNGIKNNDHLVKLKFQCFDSDELRAIIPVINKKSNIKKLSLYWCACDDAILLELARNTTLREVTLNCVGHSICSYQGILHLLHFMKHNSRLQMLDVSDNNLSQEAKDMLTSSVYKPDQLVVDW